MLSVVLGYAFQIVANVSAHVMERTSDKDCMASRALGESHETCALPAVTLKSHDCAAGLLGHAVGNSHVQKIPDFEFLPFFVTFAQVMPNA